MVKNSKASVSHYLRNILKIRKESPRWAPYLLNEEQTCTHVRTAHKLLKWFPRYVHKMSTNLETDGES